MEMFVLRHANVPPNSKLCLQVGSASWLRTYLTNQYVILRYCFPNLCKRNYLYGNLPFYKIQVNCFMAWDESSGAKIIPKCMLWMEEPGRIQSMKSLRVGHDWATSLSCIGEGNGNPLQCSCLENPRGGGAWWAAVYGVAQSRTRLKRLSSRSSSSLLMKESLKTQNGTRPLTHKIHFGIILTPDNSSRAIKWLTWIL